MFTPSRPPVARRRWVSVPTPHTRMGCPFPSIRFKELRISLSRASDSWTYSRSFGALHLRGKDWNKSARAHQIGQRNGRKEIDVFRAELLVGSVEVFGKLGAIG